jgi:AraC family transcriptional regulator of adaptative response/methylated-DNA-[protein]-cysteine methyltransferase
MKITEFAEFESKNPDASGRIIGNNRLAIISIEEQAMTASANISARKRFASDDERWTAVARRDASADGTFFFSVRTTGVYCRPGCPSRLPRRENVRFHASADAAEAAGFRACKRCRPRAENLAQRHATTIARACRLIEGAEKAPTLESLAQSAGISPFHFHRLFKSIVGITPKAYAQRHRLQRMGGALHKGSKVTDAIYDAGYASSASFYRQPAPLGMAPARYRRGGSGETIRFAVGECSLGTILVAATAQGICAILLGDDPEQLLSDLQQRFANAQLIGADSTFEQWVARVVGMVDTPNVELDLPLDIRGTAFQQRVWQALRGIPSGSTVSYSQVAERIGAPKQAVRAVAQAIAANPLAVAIPCHRVVRSDGALAGYRWGIARKQALLTREAAMAERD